MCSQRELTEETDGDVIPDEKGRYIHISVYTPSQEEREKAIEHNEKSTLNAQAYEEAMTHAEQLQLPSLTGRGSYHIHAVLGRDKIVREYEFWRVRWATLPVEQATVVFAACYRVLSRGDETWWVRARSEDKCLIDLLRAEFTNLEAAVLRRPTITSTLTMRKRGTPFISAQAFISDLSAVKGRTIEEVQ